MTLNPNSWNTHANIIFLDQPVNVGFSYSENEKVDTSPAAGKDVYAFMQLFLNRFYEYADAPFHIAAESYGGMYAPHIASIIHKANKALLRAPTPDIIKINLDSIVLANGYTNPSIQLASIPDYACDGPYPIFDNPQGKECTTLRSKVPTCVRLTDLCQRTKSRFACIAAALYCNSQLVGPIHGMLLYPYAIYTSKDLTIRTWCQLIRCPSSMRSRQ